MTRKLLGITLILALVLVRWKWDALKALISNLLNIEWFYEVSPAKAEPPGAETGSKDQTPEAAVYVTSSGARYHRNSCRSLASGAWAISLEEAKQHYRPCGRCHPPE